MKTILYATDYSENSVAALKYAQKMAGQLKYRLVITHVFDFSIVLGLEGLDEPFPHDDKNGLKHHRTKLEDFCEKHLGSIWKAPNIQLQAAEHNSVVKGIISVAEKWHAQMIITGVKGQNALRELIMGSTTKRLIAGAPCPVLAIPFDADYTAIKTLVYATDFEEEDIYAIRKLTEMVEKLNADIKIVHIATRDEYKGEMQMDWFKDMLAKKVAYDKMEFILLFSDDIFKSLLDYLGDVNADLMVMLEREHSGLFKKWFHRDLVKKMETYGKVPLLSFREGNHQLLYFSAVL